MIRREDVKLQPTARGLMTGVYMGWDGDAPARCLDALVHEIDPGTVTTPRPGAGTPSSKELFPDVPQHLMHDLHHH